MVAVLLLAILAGCASKDDGDYFVDLTVSGSADAFKDRSVFIEGAEAPPPTGGSTLSGGVAWHTGLFLCTVDRARFLSHGIRIEIREGDSELWKGVVKDRACEVAEMPGHNELETVILEDDGTVTTDFDDPRTEAACAKPQPAGQCGNDLTRF